MQLETFSYAPGGFVDVEYEPFFTRARDGSGKAYFLPSMHSCNLLGVNYCVNYSLNDGLYCTKWTHSHLLFGQLWHGLKSSMMGCAPIFCDCMG